MYVSSQGGLYLSVEPPLLCASVDGDDTADGIIYVFVTKRLVAHYTADACSRILKINLVVVVYCV